MPVASLTERISLALGRLRHARAADDLSAELACTQLLDNLLDRWVEQHHKEKTP